MSTRTYFVLARDTISPYLAVSGRSFGELGQKNCHGNEPMEFSSVGEIVRYLRTNHNVPDVTKIIRVTETIPDTATFVTDIVG